MLYSTAPALFESTDDFAVREDPANDAWVALLQAIDEKRFGVVERLYYLALNHFRKQRLRPALAGQVEVEAEGRQQALLGMLEVWEKRKAGAMAAEGEQAPDMFVEALPKRDDEDLPEALRDCNKTPPPLGTILGGAGRPPCDAMCLLRAFLVAPVLGVSDSPTSVFQLLHSNPALARQCGFLGDGALKLRGELTSRRLPSLSVCEEFSEVMTR
jgi:hypothetical protein